MMVSTMYVQHEYARFYAVVLQASTVYPPLLQHLPGCPPASSRKPVVTCKTSLSHLPVPFPYTPSACKTTLSPSHLPARVLDLQDTSISCKTTPSPSRLPAPFPHAPRVDLQDTKSRKTTPLCVASSRAPPRLAKQTPDLARKIKTHPIPLRTSNVNPHSENVCAPWCARPVRHTDI